MGRVYIHELVDIVGNNRARYQHHMTANWCPEAGAARRQRCFGVFSVVGSTGPWPTVVNLWEYDSWDDLGHNFAHELVGRAHQDPFLAEWWDAAAKFRSGGLDTILAAPDGQPGIEDLYPQAGRWVGYVHERWTGRPGDAPQLAAGVAGLAGRTDAVELVGQFEVAMADRSEAISLWGFRSWSDWSQFEAECSDGTLDWSINLGAASTIGARHARRSSMLLVDAALSPLAIGRQPSVDDRRPIDDV